MKTARMPCGRSGTAARKIIGIMTKPANVLLAITAIVPFAFSAAGWAKNPANHNAKEKPPNPPLNHDRLADYVLRVSGKLPDLAPTTPGSLWSDSGRLANMVTDYKAARVGDLVTISVAQNLSATSTGNVSSNRTFSANSGISALPGHIKTSGVQNLFSPNSTQLLSGKAQASSQTSLSTTLTGRVAAVLPSGTLVVEAERQITMNNQHETVILRGLVRPGDLDAANTVASNNVGNLEIEVKGKGVVSEGTRPPNFLVKWILRVVGF
jgi:flagellar L-ring protein precursor FlgH